MYVIVHTESGAITVVEDSDPLATNENMFPLVFEDPGSAGDALFKLREEWKRLCGVYSRQDDDLSVSEKFRNLLQEYVNDHYWSLHNPTTGFEVTVRQASAFICAWFRDEESKNVAEEKLEWKRVLEIMKNRINDIDDADSVVEIFNECFAADNEKLAWSGEDTEGQWFTLVTQGASVPSTIGA